jgi:hypothetical protein
LPLGRHRVLRRNIVSFGVNPRGCRAQPRSPRCAGGPLFG